jgi:hypothetical protein
MVDMRVPFLAAEVPGLMPAKIGVPISGSFCWNRY